MQVCFPCRIVAKFARVICIYIDVRSFEQNSDRTALFFFFTRKRLFAVAFFSGTPVEVLESARNSRTYARERVSSFLGAVVVVVVQGKAENNLCNSFG